MGGATGQGCWLELLSRESREMEQCRLICEGAGHGGEELLMTGPGACNCRGWAASMETIVCYWS